MPHHVLNQSPHHPHHHHPQPRGARRARPRLLPAALAAALLPAMLAGGFFGDTADLHWNTIDGGGFQCDGDGFNFRGTIGQHDAGLVMSSNDGLSFEPGFWPGVAPAANTCPADIAPPGGDGLVNVDDLLMVINNWGDCTEGLGCPADIDPVPTGNDIVNVDDLLMVINNWGSCEA